MQKKKIIIIKIKVKLICTLPNYFFQPFAPLFYNRIQNINQNL